MCGAGPQDAAGVRRRTDRSAARAKRQDLTHAPQFQGCCNCTGGNGPGGLTPLDFLDLICFCAARCDDLVAGDLGLAYEGTGELWSDDIRVIDLMDTHIYY